MGPPFPTLLPLRLPPEPPRVPIQSLVTSLAPTLSMWSSVWVFHGSLPAPGGRLNTTLTTSCPLAPCPSLSSSSSPAPWSASLSSASVAAVSEVNLEEKAFPDLCQPFFSSLCGSSTSPLSLSNHTRFLRLPSVIFPQLRHLRLNSAS